MSVDPAASDHDLDSDPGSAGSGSDEVPAGSPRTTRVLLGVIVVAVLVIAVAGGWFWGNRSQSDGPSTPSSTSVDAGFARDMAVHHRQAVTMAEYAMTRSTDANVRLLAFDIDATQSVQLGEMQGWLESWRLSPTSNARPMTWMGPEHAQHVGADGLMPGMATRAQMARLQSASGRALDVLFLQLMIRHHQGGVAMAQYAARHAHEPYVVLLAQKMVNLQTAEITQMEQMLRQRGGKPLPPPDV